MSIDQKYEKLIQLISELIGMNSDLLTDSCSVFHDFGVAGDDGFKLLEAIADEFEIDMSGVDSCRYFGAEAAYNQFYHLYCIVKGKKLDHDIIRLEISDPKKHRRNWNLARTQLVERDVPTAEKSRVVCVRRASALAANGWFGGPHRSIAIHRLEAAMGRPRTQYHLI